MMRRSCGRDRAKGPAGWVLVGVGLILLLLAGCGDAEPQEIAAAAPTRTLIPPTPSPTPAPRETTPTPTDLPSAAALVSSPDANRTVTLPASAQAMLDQTLSHLLRLPDVDPANVRLLGLDAVTWQDQAWGCPTRPAGDPVWTLGYRVIYSTGSDVVVYHTNRRISAMICEDDAWLTRESDPIPLDPIAQSMVEISTREAAQYWNIPEAQVRLVSLLAVEWPDSSVGCPKAGALYETVPTPGYRLVFRADDERLIYHSSIRHTVRCRPDEEILPGLLRAALAGDRD